MELNGNQGPGASSFAPLPLPVQPPTTSHVVQFYEADLFLLDEVIRFAGAALGSGDAFVVLATPEHLSRLSEGLEARGLDVTRVAAQGRYTALDAADTLAEITVDGSLVPARFLDLVGGVIDRAAARAIGDVPRVAVFGELVAILCADGPAQAAIELEHLWNDLAGSRSLSLLCAYPLDAFGRAEDAASLAEICAAHQHVIPAESYFTLTNEAARAQEIVQLQQQAAALASEVRERKRVQDLLVQRDLELTEFIERVPVALHQVNADGTVGWANAAELKLLGYTADEYIGQHVARAHVDVAIIDDILARLGRGEPVQAQPARLRGKDGSIRQVVISSMASRGHDLFSCMTLDVTDQLIATETTGRLAAIVDSSEDAIVGKLLDGTVTSWNHAAERLFGYNAAEMVGSSIARIVPPERLDEFASNLARLGRGERIAHHETERLRRDGSRIAVSISISPIYDQAGNITGVAKIARDISERRAAERRRQELLEVVAHDLRTPLTTVLGYAQLLQRRLGEDEALTAIATQASRMGRLLADVLETARMEAGRQHLRRAPYDLTVLARDSVRQAALLSGNNRIRMVAPARPVVGAWDADRLAQILANLLDNAVKFAPGADIVVEVTRAGNEARVAVRDNGPGISRAHQRRLFDRFYQVDTGKPATTGVGLGLFISRALAEAHDGRLWVESVPGQGSTFTLSLPLTPVAPELAANNLTAHDIGAAPEMAGHIAAASATV